MVVENRSAKKRFKPWKPRLWVVEIWWEHMTGKEWLYQDAYLSRSEAHARMRDLKTSGYKFRCVPYERKRK